MDHKITSSLSLIKREDIISHIAQEGLARTVNSCSEVSFELCCIIKQVLEKNKEVLDQLKEIEPNLTRLEKIINIDRFVGSEKTTLAYALEKLNDQENMKDYTDALPLLTLIDILLNYNANVKLTFDGTTPLHIIAKKAMTYAALLTKFIEKGVSVDAQNQYGCTPLHLAISHNNIAAIDLLIQHGADLEKKDEYCGRTPIGHAIHRYTGCEHRYTNRETIDHLLKNYSFKLNEQDKNGDTLMHYLAQSVLSDTVVDDHSRFSLILSLIERGATCHHFNSNGDTPLHCAIRNEEKTASIIALFIQKNAKVNIVNQQNQNPLLTALKTLLFFQAQHYFAATLENIKALLQCSPIPLNITMEDKCKNTSIKLMSSLTILPDWLKGQILYSADSRPTVLLFAKAKESHPNEKINYFDLSKELQEVIINFLIASVYPNLEKKTAIRWLTAYHLYLADVEAKKTSSANLVALNH